jgi:hypothetical protein
MTVISSLHHLAPRCIYEIWIDYTNSDKYTLHMTLQRKYPQLRRLSKRMNGKIRNIILSNTSQTTPQPRTHFSFKSTAKNERREISSDTHTKINKRKLPGDKERGS